MQTLHLLEGQKNNLLNYFSNLKRFKATLNAMKINLDISGISLKNRIYHKCIIEALLKNKKISNNDAF